MLITDFKIEIKTENIMRAADCRPDSPVYPFVLTEYEKYRSAALDAASPKAWIDFDAEEKICSVIITAGQGISDLSSELFGRGEAVAGLLVNAVGDEYVFQIDSIISQKIKSECALAGLGVKRRLEAPADMPLSSQQGIIERCGADVRLTGGFQFIPAKTMGYILELTDNASVFNAQHDCAKCTVKSCPRRSRPFQSRDFSILADYGGISAPYSGSALCVDIGTTTIVLSYMKNGSEAGSFRAVNPQRRFGADVLSRIEAANRGRLKELKQLIVFELLKGISDACGSEKPDKIIISANTVMSHLLLGLSCEGLGKYPFEPVTLDTVNIPLKELGGKDDIPVAVIGGISAFVGGDITSGIYCCGMADSSDISLFIDLGTNGEMALGNSERILVSSTAAGPAFEGGGISCGTGSVRGAVCGVDLSSGELRTIGDAPPAGLCGTGIIELVAEMLDKKIADKTGLFKDEYFESGFCAADNITFTQKDMREVQTAKSAVISGVETLLHEYGITMDEVRTVYLAGGFGYGLNLEKAERIGLLPKGAASKALILGNSSLGGAVKYSGDGDAEKNIKRIKAISTDIILGNNEYFAKRYIENINFV